MISLINKLWEFGLIPVVKIEKLEDALPLSEALLKGNLPCAEITFRTDQAESIIRKITQNHPQILTGAGTVITVEQANRAVSAGARFIVSPGISIPVIEWCLKQQVPIFPGTATPSDIITALSYGLEIIKFFPAETFGGIKTLQALSAPFESVRFIPTGGINLQNLENYIKLPYVYACGGSWFVTSKMISSGHFDEISHGASEALKIIHHYRSPGVEK